MANFPLKELKRPQRWKTSRRKILSAEFYLHFPFEKFEFWVRVEYFLINGSHFYEFISCVYLQQNLMRQDRCDEALSIIIMNFLSPKCRFFPFQYIKALILITTTASYNNYPVLIISSFALRKAPLKCHHFQPLSHFFMALKESFSPLSFHRQRNHEA